MFILAFFHAGNNLNDLIIIIFFVKRLKDSYLYLHTFSYFPNIFTLDFFYAGNNLNDLIAIIISLSPFFHAVNKLNDLIIIINTDNVE